jgi:hypothetical protein
MTYRYDVNPMPHDVAVACPACGREALFETATWVAIPRKKDIPFFKRSRWFQYVNIPNPTGASHFAVFFARFSGGLERIGKLPDGYAPQAWAPSKYLKLYRASMLGTVFCAACGLLRKHNLTWPEDAFYKVDIRGRTLWAWNRAYALDTLEYLAQKDRDRRGFKTRLALDVIPKHFTTAKARQEATKKLGNLLAKT